VQNREVPYDVPRRRAQPPRKLRHARVAVVERVEQSYPRGLTQEAKPERDQVDRLLRERVY
jgi:hypothetical protein